MLAHAGQKDSEKSRRRTEACNQASREAGQKIRAEMEYSDWLEWTVAWNDLNRVSDQFRVLFISTYIHSMVRHEMIADKTETLLSDIRAYLRSMAVSAVKPNAGRYIDSYEKAVVYEKLDGDITQVSLEQFTRIPQSTMSPWFTKFTEGGLAAPPDETHRGYRALFTLQELGIDKSNLKKRPSKASGQPQTPLISNTGQEVS